MSPRSYPPELRAVVVADYLAGMSCNEIAAARGLSKSAVGGWVKDAGISRPRPGSRLGDRLCDVDGCDRKHYARGYCTLHHGRAIRGRQPLAFNAADRLEDCRWMAETGECLDGAARRLGMKPKALEKWLANHDRACLATLVSRQPRDHNRFVAAEVSIYELTGLRGKRGRQRRKEAQYAEAGAA